MAAKTLVQTGDLKKAMTAGSNASVGGQVATGLGVKRDSVLGNVMSGDIGGTIDAAKSHAGDKAKAAAQQMEERENQQYAQNQDYNKQMGSADDQYLSTMGGNVQNYQKDLTNLKGEIEASQGDARNTYTGTIQPRLKGLMEDAQKNSASAMSLKDAMDPNNAVAQQTRKLYNDQGASFQKQYEQQAQNEGKSGLADVGVLSALGMQGLGSQLGNVPMTGGQMQAMLGASQAQAGSAFAQTQQRLQGLRDQGMNANIGQQSKGLDQGFNRSDTAYQQGLNATDRYRNSVGDVENASDRQNARDTDFRNQRGGISNQTYGLQQSMNDATRGVGNAKTQREMAAYNTHMGGQQANTAAQIGQINAQQQQQGQLVAAGMQAAGTAAGAYFGGPAGAAAGGQAGAVAGQANMPAQQPVPQAGNYSSPAYAGYSSPYQQQSQPGNFVNQGSQNGSYGGVQGVYGAPGQGGYGIAQQPASPNGLSLADETGGGFRANPYAYAQGRPGRAQNSAGARR